MDALIEGQRFHAALVALGVEVDHGADEGHDRAVGEAIARVLAGDPAGAIDAYNAWAPDHQYAPVEYLGTFVAEGWRGYLIDIRSAYLLLGSDGRIAAWKVRT
jgi:hypothetical protein